MAQGRAAAGGEAVISQLALATFGLAYVWMSASDSLHARRWAPLVGLMGQPAWVYFAVSSEAWGLLAITMAYTALYVRGALKLNRRAPR